jgi:hypothetical protein
MATNGALNVLPYWQAVGKIEATLPAGEVVFITSIDKPLMPGHRVGVTFECARRNAAMRIVDQTHRLSTPEEVKAYREAQKQRAEALRVEESLRQQKESRVVLVDRDRLRELGEA